MGEAAGEVAVVRHHEESLGIGVEPPDRKEARPRVAHQIDDAAPARRIEIRADDALGLMEDPVLGPLGPQAFAVEADVLRLEIGLRAEFGDHSAVDRDAARGDDRFAGPPRGNPGARQNFM